MDLEEIGRKIREARKAAGLSQDALATSLGMSRATISGIENATVGEIGVRKLDALCAAVRLDLFVGPRRKRPTLDELRAERHADRERA